MKLLPFFLLVFILLGCNTSDRDTEFEVIDAPNFGLEQLKYIGRMQDRRFWNDLNGENIVLLSKEEDIERGEATLFIDHYAVKNDEVTLLNSLEQSVKNCQDADLLLHFIDSSISVTDLDRDRIGEITFAFRAACVTDVSPQPLSLYIMEGGLSYSLFGSTEVRVSSNKTAGGSILKMYFDKAPPSFLTHAQAIWESSKRL